ncbi:MAG: HD domain-containing phosphohydrolase, partial [Syntrophobacteria bacterium]
MKLEKAFLQSKVARRVFMLFIACALLPIAALSILSFSHVSRQLHKQSQRRLHQASKAMGMTIVERLLFLEAEMRMFASELKRNAGISYNLPFREFTDRSKKPFEALALVTSGGRSRSLLGGRIDCPAEPTAEEKEYLTSGKAVVGTECHPGRPPGVFLTLALDPQDFDRGVLLAQVNTAYLWGESGENPVPPMTELCVLDRLGNVLFSSIPVPELFSEREAAGVTESSSGHFEWNHGGEDYIARYWSVFLQYNFATPKWIVVLSEPRSHVLAPMARFKKTFSLVVLVSLWVVLLLSISQIRRSLIPLEKLREGTRRIAERKFDTRVEVMSGDELEELAGSFNTMASRLGRQFKAMTTMNAIDRAILSALDTEKIVDTVLNRMGELFPCDCAGVAFVDGDCAYAGLLYIKDSKPRSEKWLQPIELRGSEAQALRDSPETLLVDIEEEAPQYLGPLADRGMRSCLVLPIFVDGRLSGLISLGYVDPAASSSEEDQIQARQLADQVAVALSNARLIEKLDELNWGTLYALARTIDAKSSWTAGHSERVTRLAVKIGQVMGLSQKELDDLHRGGLMHDLGKIGIPPEILDKEGKLTAEERQLMEEHVVMGARILEPIAAYAEVIPIVLHHHERFDGSGYPAGLAGEEISLGGRIFAVA